MRNVIPIADLIGTVPVRVMRKLDDGSLTMTRLPSLKARQMVERLEAIFESQAGSEWLGPWDAPFRDMLAKEFDYGMGEPR